MSKQRAYQLAKELGCEITNEGDRILLDAIPPYQLSATDGHCQVYSVEDGIKCPTTGRTAWQEIISDLKSGVELCRVTDCEICAGL